jgi:F-type H+-transporting ATPase subunit b
MTVFIAFAESIQLVPDGTLFLHIAIIILMVFILNRTLFKPLGRVLSERERHTKGSSSESHGILRDVDEKLSNYEQSLREARTESYRLIEEHRAEAVRARQQRLSLVREQLEGSIEGERREIHSQASAARVELEAEARRLASSIGNQILGRRVG